MTRPSRPYREFFYKRLRDPKQALAYLRLAFEDEGEETLELALHDVLHAATAPLVAEIEQLTQNTQKPQ